MDVFVEQLVKRKKGLIDYGILLVVAVLGVLVMLAAMTVPILATLRIIVLAGVCGIIYYVDALRNIEYEYSTTNGDFTIDQIVNRRRRKKVCSFDLRNVEEMGQYDPAALQNKTFERRLKVGTDDSKTGAWYLIVRLKDAGNTLIIFNPEERMLAAIKPFLPRQVSVNAFRGN